MKCPHCNKDIDDTLIAKHLASKGGKKSSSNLTKEEKIERSKKLLIKDGVNPYENKI